MQATLGKLLVDEGGIAPERLDEAVRKSVSQGGRLDTHLLELGLIDEARLTELMAQAYEIAPADFRALVKVDLSALRLLPSRVAERCQVFPFLLEGDCLHLLAPAPPDRQLLEEIGEMVNKQITPHLATEYRIARALSHYYGLEIPERFDALERALEGDEHALAAPIDPQPPAPPLPDRASPSTIDKHRWSLSEALTRLSAVSDRDAVIQVTLSYAASFVDCAAILGVQAGRVIGWQGIGGEINNDQLRELQVSTNESSALCTVIDTSAPFIGALDDREVHRTLLQSLHRSSVRSVLLYPVLVAGRVVALVYGDNADRPLRTSSMGDFLTFCSRIGSAFENIILSRKQQLSDPTVPTDPTDDPAEDPSPGDVTPDGDDPVASDPALVRAEAFPATQGARESAETPVAEAWTVQVDAASDLGSLELVMPQPSPQQDPEPATEAAFEQSSVPDSGDPQTPTLQPAINELESWEDEVKDTLGTAGVTPSFLPSGALTAEPKQQTGAPEADEDLAAALREAEQTIDEHENATDRVATIGDASVSDVVTPHPDEESVVFDDSVEMPPSLADAIEASVVDDDLHPDEENVVFDDFDDVVHHGDAEECAPPSESPVALDDVVEQAVLGQAVATDEDTALELGTPRESNTPATPGLSQTNLNALCDALAGPSSESSRNAARTLRQVDMRAVPMLAARFPGHVSFDPFDQEWCIPEPDELSSLVGFLVQEPAIGSEVALAHLDSSFPALRWYAVYMFKFIHDARAIKAIMPRLHDEEPRIRHLTAEVLRGYASTAGFDLVIRHLRKRLKSPVAEVRRRAIYFLGFFKDVSSVPHLIGCLTAREPELVAEASQALAAITLQILGPSQRRWLKWWDKNQTRSRVEWLIDGLRHKDRNIRYAASVELTGIAHETFGYDYDNKKREREKAVKQWERWWKLERKRMHIDS